MYVNVTDLNPGSVIRAFLDKNNKNIYSHYGFQSIRLLTIITLEQRVYNISITTIEHGEVFTQHYNSFDVVI